MIHTVKGFSVANEVEVDIFLELSCFFYDPMDVGNLISGSSAFLKSRLNIWKFSVHVLLKSRLENFEQYFASMWDECICAVVWTFVGFPGGSEVKSVCLQCGRPGFDPWVGKIPWRKKWQPTPVVLPGESQGQRSLLGCHLWGRTELDTTDVT